MNMRGKIEGICVSREKGTEKTAVSEARLVENYGIEGDAHAGTWHRQVSILSYEKEEEFNRQGANVGFGSFGENLIVSGVDVHELPVGTKLIIGEAVLEITQIGKECHNHCNIYKRMGRCIMPHVGVFAKVINGGLIKPGDEAEAVMPGKNRPFSAAVIVMSDKAASGERKDKSGVTAEKILKAAGYEVVGVTILPDEGEMLKRELINLADRRHVDVIFTSGGTGFSSRDVTPEATIEVCDRMANGIAEAIRGYSMTITKRAMFSRGVSGIRKSTLIVNLPGSPKAVEEALTFLLPELQHGLKVLRNEVSECANVQLVEKTGH